MSSQSIEVVGLEHKVALALLILLLGSRLWARCLLVDGIVVEVLKLFIGVVCTSCFLTVTITLASVTAASTATTISTASATAAPSSSLATTAATTVTATTSAAALAAFFSRHFPCGGSLVVEISLGLGHCQGELLDLLLETFFSFLDQFLLFLLELFDLAIEVGREVRGTDVHRGELLDDVDVMGEGIFLLRDLHHLCLRLTALVLLLAATNTDHAGLLDLLLGHANLETALLDHLVLASEDLCLLDCVCSFPGNFSLILNKSRCNLQSLADADQILTRANFFHEGVLDVRDLIFH